MSLTRIGYWHGSETPGWPDVHQFIDLTWDTSERDDVADYLRRGLVARAFMGRSKCRFCGRAVGSLELSDGVYIWPEGLPHYVEQHGVRLPALFVGHIMRMCEYLEGADVDDSWWRGLVD